MICPVCGANEMDTAVYCTTCGANIQELAQVDKDKIIFNQTEAQKMESGDDSMTVLIPENYMTAQGDDSVTELIPENYMTAQGDDSPTLLLDPQDEDVTTPIFVQNAVTPQPTPTFQYQNPPYNPMVQSPMTQNPQVQNYAPVEPKPNHTVPMIIIGCLFVAAIVAVALILFS